MATYAELYDLFSNSALRNRVAVAVGVAADTIRLEDPQTPNHTQRLAWAKRAFSSPNDVAREVLQAAIIANRTATIEQILSAEDTVLQVAVDDAVNVFAV